MLRLVPGLTDVNKLLLPKLKLISTKAKAEPDPDIYLLPPSSPCPLRSENSGCLLPCRENRATRSPALLQDNVELACDVSIEVMDLYKQRQKALEKTLKVRRKKRLSGVDRYNIRVGLACLAPPRWQYGLGVWHIICYMLFHRSMHVMNR